MRSGKSEKEENRETNEHLVLKRLTSYCGDRTVIPSKHAKFARYQKVGIRLKITNTTKHWLLSVAVCPGCTVNKRNTCRHESVWLLMFLTCFSFYPRRTRLKVELRKDQDSVPRRVNDQKRDLSKITRNCNCRQGGKLHCRKLTVDTAANEPSKIVF